MRTATFRIRRLAVEGFKAFVTPQVLDIGSGHLFVFGRNGQGKSSVVEAIRWCLFGLAERPEAEVRNVFYRAGECKVELELDGPGGIWKMQRRLRPGTGRSDSVILNPEGIPVTQSQVFPHLARLGPRDGTHIIFASQQATNRRPQADITEFDKVLYSYLRVEELPTFVKGLHDLLEEQKEIEKQLAKEITEVEELLRTELASIQNHVDEILRTAPWPTTDIPTNAETNARIRRFVEESGGATVRADGGAVTREWLLGEAERAIKTLSAGTHAELQKSLLGMKAKLQALTSAWAELSALEQQLTAAKARVAEVEHRMNDATRAASKEQLTVELDRLVKREAAQSKRASLIQQGSEYYASCAPTECPICASPSEPTEVLSRLAAEIESEAGAAELAAALIEVREKLAAISQIEGDLDTAQRHLIVLTTKYGGALTRFTPQLDVPEDLSSYQKTEERVRLRIAEIDLELASEGSLINGKRTQLKNLHSEVRFQEFRSREETLVQSLNAGLEPTREAYRDFLDLMDTLNDVREALQDCFNSALNTTLPTVGELMTNVYSRLTQQASFTRIAIQPGPTTAARALRVQVTSERTPDVFFEPSEVLNGQAFSALNLVPYFVFSQFQADALELDCLLIDDPSQSFDTSRIELLLQELATAASHAQLIVASHEADRFEPSLSNYFEAGSYRVLRVVGFTPEKGPSFEWQS